MSLSTLFRTSLFAARSSHVPSLNLAGMVSEEYDVVRIIAFTPISPQEIEDIFVRNGTRLPPVEGFHKLFFF